MCTPDKFFFVCQVPTKFVRSRQSLISSGPDKICLILTHCVGSRQSYILSGPDIIHWVLTIFVGSRQSLTFRALAKSPGSNKIRRIPAKFPSYPDKIGRIPAKFVVGSRQNSSGPDKICRVPVVLTMISSGPARRYRNWSSSQKYPNKLIFTNAQSKLTHAQSKLIVFLYNLANFRTLSQLVLVNLLPFCCFLSPSSNTSVPNLKSQS